MKDIIIVFVLLASVSNVFAENSTVYIQPSQTFIMYDVYLDDRGTKNTITETMDSRALSDREITIKNSQSQYLKVYQDYYLEKVLKKTTIDSSVYDIVQLKRGNLIKVEYVGNQFSLIAPYHQQIEDAYLIVPNHLLYEMIQRESNEKIKSQELIYMLKEINNK